MNRRAFLGSLAVVPAAIAATPAPRVVRPATDMDLCSSSLMEAISVVGQGPYVVTVPPENYVYARRALCAAFGRTDWRRDFTIKIERLDQYVDSWALSNGAVTFYTIGA